MRIRSLAHYISFSPSAAVAARLRVENCVKAERCHAKRLTKCHIRWACATRNSEGQRRSIKSFVILLYSCRPVRISLNGHASRCKMHESNRTVIALQRHLEPDRTAPRPSSNVLEPARYIHRLQETQRTRQAGADTSNALVNSSWHERAGDPLVTRRYFHSLPPLRAVFLILTCPTFCLHQFLTNMYMRRFPDRF